MYYFLLRLLFILTLAPLVRCEEAENPFHSRIAVESCRIVQLMYDPIHPNVVFYGVRTNFDRRILDPALEKKPQPMEAVRGMALDIIAKQQHFDFKGGVVLDTSVWRNYALVDRLPVHHVYIRRGHDMNLHISAKIFQENDGGSPHVVQLDEYLAPPTKVIDVSKAPSGDVFVTCGDRQIILHADDRVSRHLLAKTVSPGHLFGSIAPGLVVGELGGLLITDWRDQSNRRFDFDRDRVKWYRSFPEDRLIAARIDDTVQLWTAEGRHIKTFPCRPTWIARGWNTPFLDKTDLGVVEVDLVAGVIAIATSPTTISFFATSTGKELGTVTHRREITAFKMANRDHVLIADVENLIHITAITLAGDAPP